MLFSSSMEPSSSTQDMLFDNKPNYPSTIKIDESLHQYNNAFRALSVVEGISTDLASEQSVRKNGKNFIKCINLRLDLLIMMNMRGW